MSPKNEGHTRVSRASTESWKVRARFFVERFGALGNKEFIDSPLLVDRSRVVYSTMVTAPARPATRRSRSTSAKTSGTLATVGRNNVLRSRRPSDDLNNKQPPCRQETGAGGIVRKRLQQNSL
jgi:hypothetical protein